MYSNPCPRSVATLPCTVSAWKTSATSGSTSATAWHTLVLGTTCVGKTRLAELLVTQDIRRGEIVVVFDPKGDTELLARMWAECKRAGRLEQFHIFHLGFPDISERYNPVGSFGRITEVATDCRATPRFRQFCHLQGIRLAFHQYRLQRAGSTGTATGLHRHCPLCHQYRAVDDGVLRLLV